VLPGEIAEGREDAFGLRVPRALAVKARFGDAVFAEGALSPEQVANYVRERVTAAHVETGPAKTVFTGARVSAAGAGARTLRIQVARRGSLVELVVRDTTAPPPREASQEEILRSYGLDERGKLTDQDAME
jgi:hypothetical protein